MPKNVGAEAEDCISTWFKWIRGAYKEYITQALVDNKFAPLPRKHNRVFLGNSH